MPHCPEWSVADLAAHIVGVPDDILGGRMDGVTTPAWTNAQVQRYRGTSLAELAAALERLGPPIDTVVDAGPPPVMSQLVMDAVTHEHDLRYALDVPGARDSDAVGIGARWLIDMLESRVPGMADRIVSAHVDDFTVLRALSGRLCVDDITAAGLPGQAIADALVGTPLVPPPNPVG